MGDTLSSVKEFDLFSGGGGEGGGFGDFFFNESALLNQCNSSKSQCFTCLQLQSKIHCNLIHLEKKYNYYFQIHKLLNCNFHSLQNLDPGTLERTSILQAVKT